MQAPFRRALNTARGPLECALLLGSLAACGGGESATSPPEDVVLSGDATGGNEEDEPIMGLVSEDQGPRVDPDSACATATVGAAVERGPVDVVLIIDNSVSMADELAAVERNINQNFAERLFGSGLDFRVLLISRHRRFVRQQFGESTTTICVEQPLSGLASCEGAAEPAFTERFFHYSTHVESGDSFEVLLDTFEPPFDFEDREEGFGRAPQGWSAWLRPEASKVMIEMTDDDDRIAAVDFLAQLTASSPQVFGTPREPRFVFHSIVGLREKSEPTEAYLPSEPLVAATCGGQEAIVRPGAAYQELSQLTGGLRFPICQYTAYDAVFREIAGDVTARGEVACDFPLPAPPAGRELDRDRVAVQVRYADEALPPFRQAPSLEDCEADAFFLSGERVVLCPDACSTVRSRPLATLDVLFACESTVIVR